MILQQHIEQLTSNMDRLAEEGRAAVRALAAQRNRALDSIESLTAELQSEASKSEARLKDIEYERAMSQSLRLQLNRAGKRN